ncbi:MAG: glycosyltransferase family 39 protein [Sedimentisphaerales bacterium]|nr:glycosyltransferase family 39 protein [Sedimentisphaerales bacterium]
MKRRKTGNPNRPRRQARGVTIPTETPDAGPAWTRPRIAGALVVVVLAVILSCIGLDWGRSGLVPWQPDSIEGITTVREMPKIFGKWTYKYPRGHFIVNAIFYYPLVEHWKKHPVALKRPDGSLASQALTLDRLDLLAKISRLISVAMGTATILAVFLTGRLLFADYLAGLLGALALALSQLFIFYCHVGNVDVPLLFWYAWGIYWTVKAIRFAKYRHFVLMGLFFSYCVSIKEAMGGYLIGLAAAFWLAEIAKARADGHALKKAVLSVFTRKVLAAVAAFLVLFALLQGIIFSPGEFLQRMSFWSGESGVSKFNTQFAGQLPLLWDSCRMLYGSLGWPLLALLVVSTPYCLAKYRRQAGLVLIPLLAFYVVVIMNIRLTTARYFLPAYPGFAVLIGKACADWLNTKKIHRALRILPLSIVGALSLLYCIALDLEMLGDTRARTEKWCYKNIDRRTTIGIGIYNKVYAPRLHLNGYAAICPWQSADTKNAPPPDYLIMTPKWPCTNDETEKRFRQTLFDNKSNYDEVARFAPTYLFPGKSILGLAGWPVPKNSLISPEMIIFKKKTRAGTAWQTPRIDSTR